ncbi:unnamed protein product [Allacma fusca]|uniref:Uncharacterized protein n=1 Tax=Allacma fusca TaxID=39272 RepID=A0A8J2LDZ6_9HEXA|nr:unnamed protein product [Allacma fusca]
MVPESLKVSRRSSRMEEDNSEFQCDSESDESDVEDSQKTGTRDSNAMLDTWLAELDSLTTISASYARKGITSIQKRSIHNIKCAFGEGSAWWKKMRRQIG